MRHSLSSRTTQVYSHAVSKFVEFCEEFDIPFNDRWPPSDSTVSCWVSWMASAGRELQVQTIRSYISGLTKALRNNSLLSPEESLASRPFTKMCIEGVQRARADDPERPFQQNLRLPLSLAIVRRVDFFLPPPHLRSFEQRLVIAGMFLTFGGGFRSGEIFPTDSSNGLQCQHLIPSDDHLTPVSPANASLYRVLLIKSKNDQRGRGAEVPVSMHEAVRAITHYLSVRPRSLPTVPLFLRRNGSPICRTSFVSLMQSYLFQAGIADPKKYKGHSFRKGFAQELRNSGFDDTVIQLYGRWLSEAHKLYHNDDLLALAQVGRSLGRS
jgi:hypothetical protein